ncbi:unnamed protein product [Ambrosiozyma monospora]|uniref:Unnamed protein product n=1 Tax=Ambrosiozyma monospora TaxID=43982 RepID=A0A9W7DGJ6_AMBMO|nr:unnamed protein product [Ambrosiozyma monospora]
MIDELISFLNTKFEMKNLGSPSVFLGMNIDTVKDGIHISMRDSIAKLKADYDISAPLKPIDLSKGVNFFKSNTRSLTDAEHSLYRFLIGTILYLAKTVKLDVAYPVSLLPQFLVKHQLVHLTGAKSVMQYLIQTSTLGLF